MAIQYAEIDDKGMITVIENNTQGITVIGSNCRLVKYPCEIVTRKMIPNAAHVSLMTSYYRERTGIAIQFNDSEWQFLFGIALTDTIYEKLSILNIKEYMEKEEE